MNNSVVGNLSTTHCRPWNTIHIPDHEAAEEWLDSSVDDLVAWYLMPTVIAVSGLSNLAFIFMVAKHTINNLYLVVVSIADIMYMSAYFSSPLTNHIPYTNEAFCFIAFFIPYYGYLASVSMVTLVSFERYLAVCKPLQHMRMQTRSRAVRMTIAVLVAATILGVLVTPAWQKASC